MTRNARPLGLRLPGAASAAGICSADARFLTVCRSDIVAGCQNKCGEDCRDASKAQREGTIAPLGALASGQAANSRSGCHQACSPPGALALNAHQGANSGRYPRSSDSALGLSAAGAGLDLRKCSVGS